MAINTQKFLPQGKKGGTLTVLPKATLAPVKPSSTDITKVEGVEESPILVIKTKVIKIEDILKGTLAAEKKAADDKRKAEEQQEREEAENEVEGDPKTGVKFKLPLPGKIKSWWGNIKKFFFTVLFGWLFLKFMKWLPKLKGILKLLAGLAEFLIDFGGRILNGLVTMVHWGYAAFEWTRGAIENVFGEKGVKVFDKITNVLKTVLNWVLSLGIAMIALSNEFGANIGNLGAGFLKQIFARGMGRSGTRLLIKLFGPAGAKKLLVGGAKILLGAKGLAKGLPLAAVAKPLAVVAKGVLLVTAISGASMAIGEANTFLLKQQDKITNYARNAHEKNKDLKWWDPRKYFWGVVAGVSDVSSRLTGAVGGLFDIIGTPFRMFTNWIRVRSAKPEERDAVREKIAKEMMEFDGVVREKFRRFFNIFDIGQLFGFKGFISDQKGGWGAFGGEPGKTYGMDKLYTKETQDRKDDSIDMRLGDIPWVKKFRSLNQSKSSDDNSNNINSSDSSNGNSNNIISSNSSFKKIDNISSMGYSDDQDEIYVFNNTASSKLSDNSNKEEKVVALGGGTSSSSDVFASLYRS